MSDLIRREDVIDGLMALRDAHKADQFTGDLLHWTGIKAMLESIPSAEPERKWIPVTEALPEDMDRLLVTIVRSDGSKRVRSGHYFKGYFMMDNGDTWNETDKEILAWMPLPEPWRGE